MSTTHYLDLDEVLASTQKTVKFKGKEHVLQPITLETFLENVKIVEALGPSPKFEDELNAVVTMLKKAFPTMDEADLRKVPLEALNKILAFAQAHDGSDEIKQEVAKEKAANPPTTA